MRATQVTQARYSKEGRYFILRHRTSHQLGGPHSGGPWQ